MIIILLVFPRFLLAQKGQPEIVAGYFRLELLSALCLANHL